MTSSLFYTSRVEHVVCWTMHETLPVHWNFWHFSIMSCLCEERHQALPFLHAASDGSWAGSWKQGNDFMHWCHMYNQNVRIDVYIYTYKSVNNFCLCFVHASRCSTWLIIPYQFFIVLIILWVEISVDIAVNCYVTIWLCSRFFQLSVCNGPNPNCIFTTAN